jgi:hypothetical protein
MTCSCSPGQFVISLLKDRCTYNRNFFECCPIYNCTISDSNFGQSNRRIGGLKDSFRDVRLLGGSAHVHLMTAKESPHDVCAGIGFASEVQRSFRQTREDLY